MPDKCCIPNCRLQKDDPGCLKLSYFQVPNNENTRNEWSSNINQHFKEEIVLKKRSLVCAYHFEPTCFNYGGLCKIVRLKKGSCPTIFENYSSKDPDDYINDNQMNVSAKTAVVLSESKNLQRICNVSTVTDHTYAVANINAGLQDSDLQNNSQSGSLNYLVDLEKVSQIIDLQGNSHSGASDDLIDTIKVKITMPDVIDTIKGLQTNETSQRSTVKSGIYSKIVPKNNFDKNLMNKSLANINLDLIDYDDETMLRRLLEKAQKEVICLRSCQKVPTMRLHLTRQKIKNSTSLINHMKQLRLISDEVAEILKATVSEQATDIYKYISQQPKQKGSFPSSLCSFATTLLFYSPEAYNYVRKTFIKCLPHPATVSKWNQNVKLT